MHQNGQEDRCSTVFTQEDLESLRGELMQSGLDSFQTGELIASFLAVRGYGVSPGDARQMATRMESRNCSLESMRSELDKLAFIM